MIHPVRARFERALIIFTVMVCIPAAAWGSPLISSGTLSNEIGPGSFAPSGWTSSLYPRDWAPGYTDAGGRRVADFSYAGYARGERPIPSMDGSLTVDVTAPPYSASPTETSDDTARIQAAIDYVGQAGGGVVYLPEGVYYVSKLLDPRAALVIRHDNVVLRGAGRGRTRIYNTTTGMRQSSVIGVISDEAGMWATPPVESMANLAADAIAGSREVKVTNPVDFAAGDLVVVRTEATDAWLAEHGNPRNWTAQSFDATTHLRRVEEVRPDGTLVVDIPFRTDVLMRDRGDLANVFHARRHLSGVGIEDLSIGMRPHASNSTLTYDTHEASAIRLRNVTDSWVRRVSSFKPTSSPYHLLSVGIWLDNTKNVTLRDCIMALPQSRGAGNGNGYIVRGSDNLIDSCAAIQSRHAYSFGYVHSTGNVVRRSVSARPSLNSDFHMWFSASNLIEEMYLDGDSFDASFRNDGSNLIHGPTTSESVFWNTRGVRYRVGATSAPLINSIQWGWGAVVGTSGIPSRVSYSPDIDGVFGDLTVDLIEGVGDGRTLLPRSMYRDQFRRRMGGTATNVVATGTVLDAVSERFVKRATTAASSPSGSHVRLNAGDRMLYTFDVSGLSRVERARIVFDAKLGRSAMGVYIKVLSGTSPSSGSTTVAKLNRTRAANPTWVVDVSDLVRWRTATGAKTVTIEVTPISGTTPLMICTNLHPETVRRPRLELETAASPELAASVVPTSSKTAAADGSMYTYYTRSSSPTVTLDLGSVRRINAVGVAFGAGNQHFDFADVWTSLDGLEWKPAGAVCGTGCTVAIEVAELDVPVDARFVQFRGIMTSRATYPNRVTFHELEVYGD